MEEDKELERIKSKIINEMLRNASKKEQMKSVSNKPVDLTDETFAETVQMHPLVVVDFWAPWCAPCRMVAPIVEGLALDYAGRVLFGKLNMDENPQVATQFQIRSIPTILVFKNGKTVDRIVGAMPRQMLEPQIARYF
ncbi:MAG: thioredoxin [Candidatus Bathyarchaeota archaeon]